MLTRLLQDLQNVTLKKQIITTICILTLFILIFTIKVDRLTVNSDTIRNLVSFSNQSKIDELLNNKYSDSVVLCHYRRSDKVVDVLPSAELESKTSNKSIFFIETSCRGDLNVRQLCSIESAADKNPEWTVNLLFAGPVTEQNIISGNLKELKEFENVRISRIHVLEYTKKTPLESLVARGALITSVYSVSHSSDVLRAVTLYKHGGVYLDLDVVVAKPFDTLSSNWVVAEKYNASLGSSVISFSDDSAGRDLAEAFISDIASNFDGGDWGKNGPQAVTRGVKKFCGIDFIDNLSQNTVCEGVTYLGPEYFFPIPWYDGKNYFLPGNLTEGVAYGFHVWNKVTEGANVHRNSPYAKLARKYCPKTYKRHLQEFGS